MGGDEVRSYSWQRPKYAFQFLQLCRRCGKLELSLNIIWKLIVSARLSRLPILETYGR